MAPDNPYPDGPDDAGPDQHLRRYDAETQSASPAEPRSRAEYYEALRAADGRPADDRRAEAGSAGSGWDSVEDRPPPDAIRVSPERATHILDGDSTGGGHRHGVGKPGKTEFPASWEDEKIIASVLDVARSPGKPPVRQDWNDTWLCSGTRDDVEVSAVVERSGDVLTGWPAEGSPGVVRNPRKGKS